MLNISKNWIFSALLLGCVQFACTKTALNLPAGNSSQASLNIKANFYVSPQGCDSCGWSGTVSASNGADGPFASLAKAQGAVQNLLSKKLGNNIVVMIRQGTYYLPSSPTNPGTLNFTQVDSGVSGAQVFWENYPGEAPVISGGIPVTGWKKYFWKHMDRETLFDGPTL